MKENLLAISMAITLTLAFSCSENARQKKMDKRLQKLIERVQTVEETLLKNQNYLESSLNDIKNAHYASYGSQEWLQTQHEWLWIDFMKFVEKHDQLLERAGTLVELANQLNVHGEGANNARKDMIVLHGEMVDLMKTSKSMMIRYKAFHKKNQNYLSTEELLIVFEPDQIIM